VRKAMLRCTSKMKNSILQGKRIMLRSLTEADITEEYLSWLNDPEVMAYMESKHLTHTMISLKKFVAETIKDKSTIFLAIIADNKHIGNIKLGPINTIHKHGDIGIMIGNKAYWGKGHATEAIKLLVQFAFKELHLHKLTAGFYSNNAASIKAFMNAGFREEGRLKQQFRFGQGYVDKVCLGLIQEE